MTARVCIIHWIVIAIAIEVQTVGGFGIEICSIIRRDKSAPLGGVIPGVQIIQAGIIDRAIATEAKMGTFECTILTLLFYHFSSPQSRKSLPGRIDLGDLNIIV